MTHLTATTPILAPASSSASTSSSSSSSCSSTATSYSTSSSPRSPTSLSPLLLLTPNFIQHIASPTENGRDSDRKSRAPIFSLDIHPDNLRLATGGNDHFVRLWNLNAVLNPNINKNDPSVNELFAGKRHEGAVMCVRWANKTGSILASGADDGSLVIWTLEKKPSMFNSLFSGGNGENYQETLHFVKKLPSMESDVIDLAWAHDNKYLASCSLDNSIVIWDGRTFERVARCMHNSFVKGLSFDPIGQYLASQSDDGSTVLWDVSTWRQFKKIAHPFVKGAVAGIVRRPSWSPDADYLACVNAVSHGVHVAAVIPRNKWWDPRKCIHLAGHSAPVCVAKFCPVLIEDPARAGQFLSILALGSNDGRISVWALKQRPLLIVESLFSSDIMDLVWSPNGEVLLASAKEGRVAGLHFPGLSFFGGTPMSPATFQAQMRHRHQFDLTHIDMVNHSDIFATAGALKPVPPTPQKVTHTKDGRKRIQPTLIASLSIAGLQSTLPTDGPRSPGVQSHAVLSPFERCFSASPQLSANTNAAVLHGTSAAPLTTFWLHCPDFLVEPKCSIQFPEVGRVDVQVNGRDLLFQLSFVHSPETVSIPFASHTLGPVLNVLALTSAHFVWGTYSSPTRIYVHALGSGNGSSRLIDGLCLDSPLHATVLNHSHLGILTCQGWLYMYTLSEPRLCFKIHLRQAISVKLTSRPSQVPLALVPFQDTSTVQVTMEGAKYTYHPGLQGFL